MLLQVVMYHMMEVYNEIGLPHIMAQDIASGVGSFFVVALGGTAIGKTQIQLINTHKLKVIYMV